MNQIVIEKLSKRYSKNFVFKDIDLKIDSRKYNFLVGDNGTGKSTFIKCIIGEVKYSGNINKKNLKVAYAPEKITLPDYINVSNFLFLLLKTNNKNYSIANNNIQYYLKVFSLEKYAKTPICKLSQGTRQKIIIIQTLMTNGDIYIFDEPLTGLDENSKKCFLLELKRIKSENKIIIISTHRLDAYRFRSKNVINFPLGGNSNDSTSS